MDITLGLDFGTHQSKLCMSYMPNNETIYEFVEFDLPDGTKSVLFPSIIQINTDNTIRIGSIDRDCSAMRMVPPPEKPALPPQPEVIYPEEPDQTLPPEPQHDSPTSNTEDNGNGANALTTIKSLRDKQKKKEKRFRHRYKAWQQRCYNIKQAHKKWEYECRRLDLLLEQWQQEVEEIEETFKNDYAYWENNKFEPRLLRYFKQAAFTNTLQWDKEEIPADILSIWYLTYLLLYVKRYVRERFNEVFEESVSVQMGVPSGLNDNVSRNIHYRGQRMLVAARHLMERFSSPEELCEIPYPNLIDMTKYSDGDVVQEAEEYGFVVIPEAFAGLQSLTYSRRLSRGNMHLLVDIGGGTTDIAFFTIDESLLPSIHTVASFHKGLNYVLERYMEENPKVSMGEAQELMLTNTERFQEFIPAYTAELRRELNYIIEHVTREFYKEAVGTNLSTSRLVEAMINRPIVYCGGGSVYDNMRIAHHYFSDRRLIDKEALGIPNLINRHLPSELYTILATAYGLSIPTTEDIKTVDARQLWKSIADKAKDARKDRPDNDYNLEDD